MRLLNIVAISITLNHRMHKVTICNIFVRQNKLYEIHLPIRNNRSLCQREVRKETSENNGERED